MTPLIWNGVARQADTVLPMVRVTRYGPMRLTPFSRRVSMASIWFRVEAPPEPAIRPVRGWKSVPSQAGVLDRLLHRQVGVSGGIAHEAEDLAIDQLFEVQVDRTGNVAAQAHLGVGRIEANAGPTRTEVGGNGVFVIAEAGNDAQTGDNDATHADNP